MTAKKPSPVEGMGADVAAALKDEADVRTAFKDGVAIHGKSGVRMVPAGHIIVVCRDPGMRRAGIEHEALHVWKKGQLSPSQIALIASDTETFAVIEVG